MAPSPSNAVILEKLEALDRKFSKVIDDHEERIKDNETYITAKIAVDNYVAQHGTPEQKVLNNAIKDDDAARPANLVKTIIAMFGLFTAIIGLITYLVQLVLK
jgi:hypothetical protein